MGNGDSQYNSIGTLIEVNIGNLKSIFYTHIHIIYLNENKIRSIMCKILKITKVYIIYNYISNVHVHYIVKL